jgi:ribose transport system ATP-binding protein
VAVVYQELIQFDALSVADNIFMGVSKEKQPFLVNDRDNHAKTKELLAQFNCNIPPVTLIRELSVANRQIVEIIKAFVSNARIVIMDEPTAAITVEEQKNLFKIIKQLKQHGVTVIYISHRLEELFEICDRISVLRDGKYITTKTIAEMDKPSMIKLMVGRELSSSYPEKEPAQDETVLSVEGVSGNGLTDINFKLRRGEILGFAGLVGAGRTELMRLICGAAKKTSGRIVKDGKDLNLRSPRDGIEAGIGLIPEDRKAEGCFIDKPIYWNISISNLDSLSGGFVVNNRREMAQAEEYKQKLRLKTPSVKQLAVNLSGGNQQKVVLAKVMAIQPDILIFDEPTRGIDVGARYEIYTLMNELTRQGKSILMVSSDMEELLGLSERVVVLHEGRQTGVLSGADITQEKILSLASGL